MRGARHGHFALSILAASLSVSCLPNLGLAPVAQPETELLNSSPEDHSWATLAQSQSLPDGTSIEIEGTARVYVATALGLFVSFDGGATFSSTPLQFTYPGDFGNAPGCETSAQAHIAPAGDVDVLVSRPTSYFDSAVGQLAYATSLLSDDPLKYPYRSVVIRTGPSGSLTDGTIQCAYITEPDGVYAMDKLSLAIVDFPSLQTRQPLALWVAFNDQGQGPSGSDTQIARSWVAQLPLDASTGAIVGTPPATAIASPNWNPLIENPTPIIRNNCHGPPGGIEGQLIDPTGRGNLWSTSEGDVYYAFSTVPHFYSGMQTVRIYVEKLTGDDRWISCVDEFDSATFASQGHLELHDPEMVIDEITGTMGVTYAKPDYTGEMRAFLATSSASATPWTYRELEPEPAGTGDQSQPAIALTNYTDALDRTFLGTIGVSWYAPYTADSILGGSPSLVTRVAQTFYLAANHNLGATTNIVQLSVDSSGASVPFSTINPTQPFDIQNNRGVEEFQGITQLPGLPRGGGWFANWAQPTGGQTLPGALNEFDTYWTRWP